MIGVNVIYESRKTGKFICSIREGKTHYDAYYDDSNIVLFDGSNEFKALLVDIINKPDDYLFTPFLEAYNEYRYNHF